MFMIETKHINKTKVECGFLILPIFGVQKAVPPTGSRAITNLGPRARKLKNIRFLKWDTSDFTGPSELNRGV